MAGRSLLSQPLPGIDRCLLASATIRLASTAPSPHGVRETRGEYILAYPSVYVPLKEFPHPAAGVCGCLLIVFQPATKHALPGPELRIVKTVVNARIHD